MENNENAVNESSEKGSKLFYEVVTDETLQELSGRQIEEKNFRMES